MLPQPPKISFCTTCMGRLEHLKRTLPQNIADNPNAQFVLVNYGGEKDTETWVKETLSKEVASGTVKYVSYPNTTRFRHSHAKNIAHRLADGDILCNVDADQFLGKDFDKFLAEGFTKSDKLHQHIFMRHSPIAVAHDGNRHASSLGKIALLKKDFQAVHGYNEAPEVGRGDDTDLNARLILHLMRNHAIPLSWANGIEHSDEMRVERMDDSIRDAAAAKLRATAYEHGGLRSIVGKATRLAGRIISAATHTTNPEGYGRGNVFINFSDHPTHLTGFPDSPPLTDKQLDHFIRYAPFLDKVEAVIHTHASKTPAMAAAVEASIALQRDAANLYADQPAAEPVTQARVAATLRELHTQYAATGHTAHRDELNQTLKTLRVRIPSGLTVN